eukprot:c13784_g1_i1 orf=313-1482(+)
MSAYEREAEAEAMAMTRSPGASNGHAEAMSLGMLGAANVQAEAMAMATSPTLAAGTAPKTHLPMLDLLHWSEAPNPNPSRSRMSATNDSSAFMNASDERPFLQPPIRSEVRTSQPAGGTSTISFGSNLTLEESEQLHKRRPGSDSKRREMIGSRIFEQEIASKSAPDLGKKTLMQAAGVATPVRVSNNVLTEDSAVSPKKPASLSEVAKQRELSGTFLGMGRDTSGGRRPCSSAKSRELEGSNIFGRSTQDQLTTKCLTNDLNKLPAGTGHQENNAPPRTSVKVSNPAGGRSQISFVSDGGQHLGTQGKKQGHNQKAAELSGHDIFKDSEASIANSNNSNIHNDRIVSAAKRREMVGNDIFSDMNAVIGQDRPRRMRQPPGGESNLKLI